MNIAGTWNFGILIDALDNSYIYYSSHINNNSQERLDIYRIKYRLSGVGE